MINMAMPHNRSSLLRLWILLGIVFAVAYGVLFFFFWSRDRVWLKKMSDDFPALVQAPRCFECPEFQSSDFKDVRLVELTWSRFKLLNESLIVSQVNPGGYSEVMMMGEVRFVFFPATYGVREFLDSESEVAEIYFNRVVDWAAQTHASFWRGLCMGPSEYRRKTNQLWDKSNAFLGAVSFHILERGSTTAFVEERRDRSFRIILLGSNGGKPVIQKIFITFEGDSILETGYLILICEMLENYEFVDPVNM